MIINGNPAGNVGWWSAHLLRTDTNERAEVKEITGVLAADLPTALREMEAIAAQSRSGGNFMYQANINPRDDERLTPEQWQLAVDTLEKNLGLEGHQRVVVEHEKEGRTHRHVIWNRVDVDTLRIQDAGGNYYTHERTARELEQNLDLARTQSLHGERRPDGRPDRPAELWEFRAAERSGIDPKVLKAELTELWHSTDSGKAFAAAIQEERGYILARGDRRDFCVVDQTGTAHSLARRLDGVRLPEMRERMADVDRESLPSVAEARAEQRSRDPLDQVRGQDLAGDEQQHTTLSADQDTKAAERQEQWQEKVAQQLERVDPAPTLEVAALERAGLEVLDVASGAVAKLGDFISDLFAVRPPPTPEEQKATNQVEQLKAQRRALHALENIRESMEKGDRLSASDVQNLTPTHIENIRARGDDYLRSLIDRMDYQRQRERDYERARER